jgi:AcrR family transcriptional regulator
MSHINKKRPNTRQQIIQVAAKLFIDEGFQNTSIGKIAKILDLSPGNITFYFKSKDHLLAELVNEQISFQQLMMEQTANEGTSSLLSYCLELTVMASICEEDAASKDYYASVYTAALTLKQIRQSDTEKTKAVFGDFCPDWSQQQWEATENIVSGIEYATIMTDEADIPLAVQIEKALNSILLLYGVPENLRHEKIQKVLSMDYRALGRKILTDFKQYMSEVNEQKLASE